MAGQSRKVSNRSLIVTVRTTQQVKMLYFQCCFVSIEEAAASTVDMGFDLMSEVEEMKLKFESDGVEACRSMLKRKREEWNHGPLNVAVIGNSGVGKSSFINAIRGLTADDEGAADIDMTIVRPTCIPYVHPNNPMLKFWDLPGVGTDYFPRSTYLEDIDVDSYDFFLLIIADRSRENDTWLGNEICKRNKKYFLVRTKIGVDISNNKEAYPKTHNEEAVIAKIRESTQEHLRANGCEDVPVFLIDNYQPTKYDFELLKQRLLEDCSKLKKFALFPSLQATSKTMIRLTMEDLRSRMWKIAALSGVVAAIPVPGVTTAFDFAVVSKEFSVYFTQLGLDETSLGQYATVMSSDYKQLHSIVVRRLGSNEMGLEGIKKVIQKHALRLPAYAATAEVSRYIPVIGSLVLAPSVSCVGTYNVLNLVLDVMESVALEVVTAAANRDASADQSGSD